MSNLSGPSYQRLTQDDELAREVFQPQQERQQEPQRPKVYYNEGEFDAPSSEDDDTLEDDLPVYGEKDLKDVDEEEGMLSVGGPRQKSRSPLRYLIFSLLALLGLAAIIGFFGARSYTGTRAGIWGIKPLGTRKITMDHVFNGTFTARGRNIRWVPEAGDGIYTIEEGSFIKLVHISTNDTKVLVNKRDVQDALHRQLMWYDWSVSSDMRYILIKTDARKQWRWSSHSSYYIHDTQTNLTRPISPPTTPSSIAHATLSPRAPYSVTFVQDNDIYLLKLPLSSPSDTAIRITDTGSKTVFNGVPDWVYEEEVFSGDSALWYSPDGRFVAYLMFDESDVNEYTFPVYNVGWNSANVVPYTNFTTMKYPKPGYANPHVSLHVFDTSTPYKAPIKLSWDGIDPHGDRVLTEVVWATEESLLVKEVDRAATKGAIYHFDLRTGPDGALARGQKVRTLGKDGEEGDEGWIEVAQTILPLESGGYIDIVPTKEGYNHIAYFPTADASSPNWLTSGTWEVAGGVLGVNEEQGLVYFTAANPSSIERHIFSAPLRPSANGIVAKETPLTDITTKGYYSATFSPKCGYYVLRYEGPQVPNQKVLSVRNSSWEYVLEDNHVLSDVSSEFMLPTPVYGTIVNDGYELNTIELRPPGFDPSGRTKYPVFFQVYNGPNAQLVNTRFGIDWHSYLVTSLKYIVVRVDGRGTGFKGRKMRNVVKSNLGKWEVVDQIFAAKEWSGRDYVDRSRVGIWGWSYGGYMTAKIAEADAGYHKLAISVAPVTDWRMYDSIYTERYMGLPSDDNGSENSDGVWMSGAERYDISGVHNVSAFDKIDYALAHGSGDDNVHYANTAHLLDMFTTAHIRKYRFRMFTDSDHSISTRGAYRELHEWLTAFLLEKWGHGALPKEW